ncbi:hypothetical protein [Amaricoccus macauensis]|uniref:hypothetical protein n=1 Tax=Amaricoccus macauensis TaxID=57001 RepID=UPI003C7A884B
MSYSIFTAFTFFFALGVLLGTETSRVSPRKLTIVEINQKKSVIIKTSFFLLCFLTLFILFFGFGIRTFSDLQRITSDRFNLLRELTIFLYLSTLVRISFFIYAISCRSMGILFWLAFCLTLFIMITTGARVNTLTLILILGLIAASRGIKVHWLWAVAVLPLGGAVSISMRYYFRAFTNSTSIMDLVESNGGWISIFINPFELHYFQTITSIVSLDIKSSISRYPFEELLGLATLPIPRSVFSLKPVSASIEYSELIAPEIWAQFKTQATIGLYGVTYIEMGTILGSVFLILFGFVFSRLVARFSQFQSLMGGAILCCLLVGVLILNRTGIIQMGQFLWPAIVLVGFVELAWPLMPKLPLKRGAHRPSDFETSGYWRGPL